MATEETNAPKVFERQIITKIYGPIEEEEERWRIETNKEIRDILQRADDVKFIKLLR